jgi:hypothetical protein
MGLGDSMLSDFQQTTVWESWLSAEIRAAYFAQLVQTFQFRQKMLVVGGLLLSSGATLTLLTAIVPPSLNWIKPTLTLLAAASSLWSLVAKNERSSIECADLHSRWNTLALHYEALWSNMDAVDAADTLMRLRTEEIAISKSSTSLPAYARLLRKAQDNVVMHHRNQLAT